MLRKVVSSLVAKNMQISYNVLRYRTVHKLAIEIDETGNSDRNVDFKIKRQIEIEQELEL